MREMPSHDELQNMSDEEIRELNMDLARQTLRRFILSPIIKWAIIITVVETTKRVVKTHMERGKVA